MLALEVLVFWTSFRGVITGLSSKQGGIPTNFLLFTIYFFGDAQFSWEMVPSQVAAYIEYALQGPTL